jgi:hypothetical protein
MINQGDVMKQWKFALPFASLLVAGCDLGGNVYAMPSQQVYDKLSSASVSWDGKGPFGKLDVSPGGDGSGTVRWSSSYGTRFCEANIVPEGTDKSRINVFCDGPGEGAATGMMQAMYRSAIIEHIDATLKGRPYDRRKALGETASTWPKDPRQADGSIGAAAGEALKMDRDMHKAISEMDNMSDQMEAERQARRANGDVNFKPGQPMVNPSSN